VDRCAPGTGHDPGLAQHGHGLAVLQRRLQRSQLPVYLAQATKLCCQQLLAAATKAVQIEQQPAEITVGELARGAQVTQAPAHSSSRSEARLSAWGLGARWGLSCGGRGIHDRRGGACRSGRRDR
jgi:hypothetical protein